jgi:hypothetical protein
VPGIVTYPEGIAFRSPRSALDALTQNARKTLQLGVLRITLVNRPFVAEGVECADSKEDQAQ